MKSLIVMKTLIRNFTHTFRRFFAASVLNIIGLAIAFASFFVIMTQVEYDLNFNKGYKDYEKIFRLEVNGDEEEGFQLWTARPVGEMVGASSPHGQTRVSARWHPTNISGRTHGSAPTGQWRIEKNSMLNGRAVEVREKTSK